MSILVTGGAGFIGRWLVKRLLENGQNVLVLDDLSNGSLDNIDEFKDNPQFHFVKGDIKDTETLKKIFTENISHCFHLAANIIVQESIDNPKRVFENDVIGTFNVLEQCKKYNTKMIFMSTCMVYDRASNEDGIDEDHPTKPASPYAGSKIAAENMVLSYYYTYSLPVVIVRPFNTYGPYQKSNGEGGVVPIFINNSLRNIPLKVYGTGNQTRDLLYVEDCADFLVKAGFSNRANGEIINAGTGMDIAINDLAYLISKDKNMIEHVPHIHPQSEIMKLKCNYSKAKMLLGWSPKVSLEEGIQKTRDWLKSKLKQGEIDE